ncbi:MAG: histidinol-phosphate transaminase [Gammaproteobacteria bacterium]
MKTSNVIQLARPAIRELTPYVAANYADGLVRLNANETPWPAPGGEGSGLNHYPPERPIELTARLADYYGVENNEILVTRGSSEAIDLLIRGFCEPGKDAVVISSPTFGMYRVYADIQGARVHDIPLRADAGYALDTSEIARNWPEDGKILFVCSPNNPTGQAFDTEQLKLLCGLLHGRALIVLDAAYAEFTENDGSIDVLSENDNVVVLRTLSKAFGLAGARCGAMLGPPGVVSMLSCIIPPYAFSTPCQEAVMACLTEDAHKRVDERCTLLRTERERVAAALKKIPGISEVYPSDANFLMVKTDDPEKLQQTAQQGGVLIRNFGWQLPGCLRITIGTPEQNDQLLNSFKES